MNRLEYTVVLKFTVDVDWIDAIQRRLDNLKELGTIVSIKAKSVRGKKAKPILSIGDLMNSQPVNE